MEPSILFRAELGRGAKTGLEVVPEPWNICRSHACDHNISRGQASQVREQQ